MKKIIVMILISIVILSGCDKSDNIPEYDFRIGELETEIDNLDDAIIEKEMEIEELIMQLKDSNDLIFQLEDEKSSLIETIELLENANKKEENEILNLSDEIIKLENKIIELTSETSLQRKINELYLTISSLRNEIDTVYKGLYTGEIIDKESQRIYNPFIISSSNMHEHSFKGYVFGGFSDGLWFTLNDFTPYGSGDNRRVDLVKGNEDYTFYNSTEGVIGKYNGQYPKVSIDNSMAEKEFITLNYDLGELEDYELVVGVSGDWDAQPRKPFLKEDGSMMIDIDGDGNNEVLVSEKINNYKDGLYLISQYGKTLLFELENYVHRKNIFIDLNGDGILEMVLEEAANWNSFSVHEYIHGKFVHIDSHYVGD